MKKTLLTLLSGTFLVLVTFSESNAQKKRFFGQVPPVRTQNGDVVNNPNRTSRQGRWNSTRTSPQNTNNTVWRNRDGRTERDDDRYERQKQNKKYYKSNNGKHKGWYKNKGNGRGNGNGNSQH